VGYQGVACDIESRDDFLGWWGCEQWTWTSQTVDTTFLGPSLGSIKFECGNSIPQIEFFLTANSSGLMLLSSANTIIGLVTENKINFESQNLTAELSVYGSARMGIDQILRVELYFINSSTTLTEVARGRFILARHFKDCM